MVEGDEWKQTEKGEFNSPERVFRDEYTIILETFRNVVLKPFVNRSEEIDRYAISMTKSDLEWKLNEPNFKKLPFQIQDAYHRFKKLADAIENAKDEEIISHKDILSGLSNLLFNCITYGRWIEYSHTPRNYCREDQYKTNSAIRKAEENSEPSELLEAEKGMFDVCKKCPYK